MSWTALRASIDKNSVTFSFAATIADLNECDGNEKTFVINILQMGMSSLTNELERLTETLFIVRPKLCIKIIHRTMNDPNGNTNTNQLKRTTTNVIQQ